MAPSLNRFDCQQHDSKKCKTHFIKTVTENLSSERKCSKLTLYKWSKDTGEDKDIESKMDFDRVNKSKDGSISGQKVFKTDSTKSSTKILRKFMVLLCPRHFQFHFWSSLVFMSQPCYPLFSNKFILKLSRVQYKHY